ncbi:MAG: calcium-binding protein [Saprospiraceae bacterium]
MTPKERKDKIYSEIVVDAYDEQEINLSWYYYFEENLEFPISAVAKLKKRNGQYENVEVMLVEVASEADKDLRFGFVLTMKGYVFPINPKDIVSVDTTEEQQEMLNDWLFWNKLELL